MPWAITDGPEEVPPAGYDGTIWRWRLETDGRAAVFLVKVSGTAMVMDDADLPSRTVEARATHGRSEADRVLDWHEPPSSVHLGTWPDSPTIDGGSRDTEEDSAEIEEIAAWFDDRGIELIFDRFGPETWSALMLPKQQRIGAADYGVGPTRLAAARDARDRHERGHPESAMVVEIGTAFETNEALPITPKLGSTEETLTDVSAAFELPWESLGVPKDKAARIEEVATAFGWYIGFHAEPDGGFTWVVYDRSTDEVLQHGQAADWDDAKLEVILNLYPPSDEASQS